MQTIEIVNLKCNGCVNTVKKGLSSIEGLGEAEVDLEASKITIPSDDVELLKKVKDKLAAMGYPEIGEANTMIHKAKSYVSCAKGKFAEQ